MSFLRTALIITILIFALTGCGILECVRSTKSERNYKHTLSCGPEALSSAFEGLEEKYNVKFHLSKEKISEIILRDSKCGSLLRDFFSVFAYEAQSITWPSEIRTTLKKHGFKMQEVRDFNSLNLDQVAIILVHKKGALNYHWMCYPVNQDILNFFGKKPIIKKIYIIKK